MVSFRQRAIRLPLRASCWRSLLHLWLNLHCLHRFDLAKKSQRNVGGVRLPPSLSSQLARWPLWFAFRCAFFTTWVHIRGSIEENCNKTPHISLSINSNRRFTVIITSSLSCLSSTGPINLNTSESLDKRPNSYDAVHVSHIYGAIIA